MHYYRPSEIPLPVSWSHSVTSIPAASEYSNAAGTIPVSGTVLCHRHYIRGRARSSLFSGGISRYGCSTTCS